jgi:peptidoglycan-associated lipoprotein
MILLWNDIALEGIALNEFALNEIALENVDLKKRSPIMSVSYCRNLKLLTVLAAACVLAACATTDNTRDSGTLQQESPAQVESESTEVVEPQQPEVATSPFETQSQIEPEPAPSSLQADAASESMSAESEEPEVDEIAVFPESQYEIEQPLQFESESDADADAEINRLREELVAREAELERSRAREAEAERSRELDAELERNRALEAELERSRALEAEAERIRALEAEQVRSRELEAELERSREQLAEAERNRELEAELQRSRELADEAERNRALQAELERSRAQDAEAQAEFERSLAGEPDGDLASEPPYSAFSDSDQTQADADENYIEMPAQPTLAQASESPDASTERTSFPPGKPVEYSIYFAFNQAMLELEFEPVLKQHAEYLKANPELTVEIQGNCDERGSREYNIALGARRAQAVKRALEVLGVGGGRIETLSFGAEKPIAFGHDEESWRLNRRADIVY